MRVQVRRGLYAGERMVLMQGHYGDIGKTAGEASYPQLPMNNFGIAQRTPCVRNLDKPGRAAGADKVIPAL